MVLASSSNNFVRSLWFNATTNPISNKANNVYQAGTVYENFMVNYTVICLISLACPFNTAVNLTTLSCAPCNISNSAECATLSVCKTCVGSTAWNGVSCAASCLAATNNACGVCNMSLYCQTCANDSYIMQAGPCGGTKCTYCSSFIPNCHRCLNTTYCLKCINSLYFLSINNNKCILCVLMIPNCLTCSIDMNISVSNCTKCINNSYFINPDRLCSKCS
jgi:hypothetical protein